jgi:histidinol-phosphate aminotransferase
MTTHSSRRQWIQQSSFALLGLGISFKSMGNEEGIKRITGIENGLINLGSNENPYGISAKAKQAILDMMGETNRYPFNVASLQSAKKTLGEYYKVSEDQVLITAGSGEGLAMLARHFNKGKYCYSRYNIWSTSQHSKKDRHESDRSTAYKRKSA